MSGRRARREAPGRGALVLAAGALVGIAGVLAGGCSLHQDGVRPPDNRIFFPGGAIIEDGDGPGLGRWLYVVNSNSDLRYSAGTVVAVDLHKVLRDYRDENGNRVVAPDGQPWRSCGSDTRSVPGANVGPNDQCCWDYLDENILNCDEQKYIYRQGTVGIGSFGGRPVIQQLNNLSGTAARRRMFVPVRGDVAIEMMEVDALTNPDGVSFLCTGQRSMPTEPQVALAGCDPNWRITREDDPLQNPNAVNIPDAEVVHLPDEPYALAVDNDLALLYVGHLRGASVSLIDLGAGMSEQTPALLKTYQGVIPADVNGSQGVTSLTIKYKNRCGGPIFAASRYSPLIGSFVVYGDDCSASHDQTGRSVAIVGTGQFLSTGLGGAETRGIEFVTAARGSEPDRAFVLQRTPPAVVAVDMNSQVPFATVEVCQSPTNLVQQTDAAGRTVALFVTCFDAGEVDVIDPWTPRLRTAIPVGRGPVATVLPPANAAPEDATRAYVVGFGANDIAVIDIDTQSPTQYRVIQRVGFPSPVPREVANQ